MSAKLTLNRSLRIIQLSEVEAREDIRWS